MKADVYPGPIACVGEGPVERVIEPVLRWAIERVIEPVSRRVCRQVMKVAKDVIWYF